MASMQRLLKRPPEPDEVAAVRSRALERLAAMTDPDRNGAPTDSTDPMDLTEPMDSTEPTAPIEVAVSASLEAIRIDDRPNEPDPTEPDEDIEMIDANDGPSSEPWRLQGPWRLVAEEEIDAEPADEPAGAEMVVDRAEPDGERSPAAVIALGEPVDVIDAVVESDDAPEVEVDAGERADAAEPATQVALFPAPDPSLEAAPAAAVAVALPETAYCPYCATTLRPAPRATRRCAQCRQKIVVRQVDERIVYLAEAALPVFDAERRRLAAIQRWATLRDHWLALALLSGAPRDRIARATGEVASEAKVSAARALYLATVDHAFESAIREDRWEDAAQVRYDEALVLFDAIGAPVPRAPEARALPSTPAASR